MRDVGRRTRRSPSRLLITLIAATGLVLPAAGATAQPAPDPREGLGAGIDDAEQASWNADLIAHLDKPEGFYNPANPGDFAFANSDMAFSQSHAFVGNYAGVQIYDVTDPSDPELRTAVACPGGQGDVSVVGDLMFISVQQFGTVDCQPLTDDTAPEDVFLGVRVFDISDLDSPEQVAAVQACRGSHTHTAFTSPGDADNVWVYVSGTSGVRDSSATEGLDCEVGPMMPAPTDNDPDRMVPSNDPDDFDAETETDRYQIEVIQVPVDSPADAEIVAEPRLFADEATGNPVGLSGQTDACHDITAFPELDLAAGACEGNGLLIDISDPSDPVRIDYVEDQEHFAYWHSATFSNDGSKVVFTDELGGGVQATCVPGSDPDDGANAIFTIEDPGDGPQLDFRSYHKIPINQTETENCVAHNGSIVPVPGRDLMVQAWYQGGWSVMDFTDPDDPFEVAFFDRGPLDEDESILGGFWSAYYYNGHIYGSEIARGFDVFELTASDHLSQAELDEAASVRWRELTPQQQTMVTDADRSACAGVVPVEFPDVSSPAHGANISCIAGYGIALGFPDGTYGPGQDVDRDQMASFIQRVLATAGVELPASPSDAFDDDDGNTHEEAINQLVELGVVQGKTATTYAPDDQVTRAQMAALIVRAVEKILGEELPAPRSPFTDVPSGGVHTTAIDKAHAAGLVEGRTATTFEPNEDVRRDQMASFIGRTLELLFHELVELNAID
ncbi:MAG: S-layer homology domain-containing protein [Nitriliruptor sp.]